MSQLFSNYQLLKQNKFVSGYDCKKYVYKKLRTPESIKIQYFSLVEEQILAYILYTTCYQQ